MDVLTFVLEIIGTVAFAVSGAMTGMKKGMDLFGVIILGLTTAVGGGILRDLILGITPPRAFQNPVYTYFAIATSIVIFMPVVRRWLMHNSRVYERTLFVMDTVGLAVFTEMGLSVAYDVSSRFNGFLLLFVGVVTGIGGGVLRDVLAGDTPYVFVKHIYASASILGAAVSIAAWRGTGSEYAMVTAGMTTVIAVRCISARYKLNLPRAREVV